MWPAAALAALGFFAPWDVLNPRASTVPTYGFKLVDSFPHDPAAFTQGLYYESRGTLLESTGMYGESSARRVELATGRVLDNVPLEPSWFGEGIAIHDGGVIQLLWQEGLGLLRNARSLALEGTFALPRGMREGWGLTHDDEGRLYASDGSSTLHVLSGDTLEPARTVTVRAGGRPLANINELQWVRGEVWANIWRDDRIAAIDPASGEVRCFVDLAGLLTAAERRACGYEEVLNGIAYDAKADRLFVTGKCWPRLYQIQVDAPGGPGAGRRRLFS